MTPIPILLIGVFVLCWFAWLLIHDVSKPKPQYEFAIYSGSHALGKAPEVLDFQGTMWGVSSLDVWMAYRKSLPKTEDGPFLYVMPMTSFDGELRAGGRPIQQWQIEAAKERTWTDCRVCTHCRVLTHQTHFKKGSDLCDRCRTTGAGT